MTRRHILFLLLALLALSCSRDETRIADNGGPPPVIVISIDTLRADRLPAYGYAGVQTPNLDRFRSDAILFRNAYSHCPLTLPSHVSILTGLLPEEHGVRNNVGYRYDAVRNPSVTAGLKQAGYATGAAVSAYVLRSATGLATAFDFYEAEIANVPGAASGNLQRESSTTIAAAQQWISASSSKPFFFLLHLFDPHTPYAPPEPHRTRYAGSPYDGEIAAVDESLGRFFDYLRASNLYEKSLIIVLSDHGEGLGDHGEDEHGVFLYREAIHVPLLVKLPGGKRAGETVDAVAQLIDVAPTILEVVGQKPPQSSRGKSLLSLKADENRRVFSETMYPRLHLGWSELRSAIDRSHHAIAAPSPELYDLAADPAEKNNIVADQRRIYAELRREIDQHSTPLAPPSAVSAEEAANLAALGYLGSQAATTGPLPDPKEHIGELNLLRDGSRFMAQQRIPEAIAAFQKAVEKNPALTDGWSMLAAAFEAAGRNDDAVKAYQTALRKSPALADELLLSIGALLMKLKRFDEAEQHATLALKRNPAAAHTLLARIASSRGDLDRAAAEARKGAEDPAFRAQATMVLAQTLAKQQKLDEALGVLDALKRETAAKGTEIELLDYARGDILAVMGRNAEAETAFRAEIANFPQTVQAYSNLAVVYALQQRADDVRRTLQLLVANNPNPRGYRVAAETLSVMGDERAAAYWRAKAEGK